MPYTSCVTTKNDCGHWLAIYIQPLTICTGSIMSDMGYRVKSGFDHNSRL